VEELKKLGKMLKEADPNKNPMWKKELETQLLIAKFAIELEIQHLNTMLKIWQKI